MFGAYVVLIFNSLRRNDIKQASLLEVFNEGFFISLLLINIFLLISIYLNIDPRSILLLVLLLIIVLGIIYKILLSGRHYSRINLNLNKIDIAILLVHFSFTILYQFFVIFYLPRTLTPDETTYLFVANLLVSQGIAPTIGTNPHAILETLLQGRYLWVTILSSGLFFVGMPLSRGYVLTTMFLPAIAINAALIFSELTDSHKLRLIVSILAINASIVLFSSTALNEVPLVYLTLATVYYTLKAIDYDTKGNIIGIRPDHMIIAIILTIFMLNLKPNLLFLGLFFIIVLVELMHRIQSKGVLSYVRRAARILAILIIFYIILVDIPYGIISVILLERVEYTPALLHLKLFLRKFLLFPFSISEGILGLFFKTSWDSFTLFTLSTYEKYRYLYAFLSPELFTLMLSSIFLVIPLLFHILKSKNRKALILMVSTYASFWLLYVLMLGAPNYEDLLRYGTTIYPLIPLVTVYVIQQCISERSYDRLISATLLGSSILTSIYIILQAQGLGIKFFWAMRAVKEGTLVYQLLATSVVFMLMVLAKNKRYEKAITWVFILTVVLLHLFGNMYAYINIINGQHHDNFVDSDLSFLPKYVEGNIVLTNTYGWLRLYLINTTFLATLPRTLAEFNSYLPLLPSDTTIVLTMHGPIAWLDPANRIDGGYAQRLFDVREYCAGERCIILDKVIQGSNGITIKVFKVVSAFSSGKYEKERAKTDRSLCSNLEITSQLINATHRTILLENIDKCNVSRLCILVHEYTFSLFYKRMITMIKEIKPNTFNGADRLEISIVKPYEILTPVSGAVDVLVFDCSSGSVVKHEVNYDFALDPGSLLLFNTLLLTLILIAIGLIRHDGKKFSMYLCLILKGIKANVGIFKESD
jgi:hypothetical protein